MVKMFFLQKLSLSPKLSVSNISIEAIVTAPSGVL